MRRSFNSILLFCGSIIATCSCQNGKNETNSPVEETIFEAEEAMEGDIYSPAEHAFVQHWIKEQEDFLQGPSNTCWEVLEALLIQKKI